VIEVPSSVPLDPPRAFSPRNRRKPTIITMRKSKPVGVLGMTDEERAELGRSGKWPTRKFEAIVRPGLSLTSLPSQEWLRGYLARCPKRAKGAPSKLDVHLMTAAKCLRDASGRTEEARKLYVERVGGERDTASRQFSRALKTLQTLWDRD
jgi:hypothetical protein